MPDYKSKWKKCGVGWEMVTRDNHGNPINWWFSLKFDRPIMQDEKIAVFKQKDEKLKEILKRELTDKDPRLICMTSVRGKSANEEA